MGFGMCELHLRNVHVSCTQKGEMMRFRSECIVGSEDLPMLGGCRHQGMIDSGD